MFAIGRRPHTPGLGLEAAGVRLGPIGAGHRSTTARDLSVPIIYAVGDVTDRVNLTPVAIREGHAFADTVFGGKPWHMRSRHSSPSAVFTTPEIGTVGLTRSAGARGRP